VLSSSAENSYYMHVKDIIKLLNLKRKIKEIVFIVLMLSM